MSVRHSSSTRREFFTTTALAVAGTLGGARALRAGTPVVGTPIIVPHDSSLPVAAFLSDTMVASDLESFATAAADAAQQAGASYADVRISEQHWFSSDLGAIMRVMLSTEYSYGVRALVNGVWGFAYGRTPTLDAMTQCARDAVASARVAAAPSAGRTAQEHADAWVPAPAARGEWRTPIQIDPFTVPVQQHIELQQAMTMMSARVPGTFGTFSVEWMKETRVVATTTGSCVTQHLHRMFPRHFIAATFGTRSVPANLSRVYGMSGGYEALLAPDLADHVLFTTENAMRLARLPRRTIDVGRYPVVFDGSVMGRLLVNVIGPSLELDRIVETGSAAFGTSRMALDQLGTPVASPLLTLTGHRAMPSVTAVQWDDEGSVPQTHTVIEQGVLQDFHTGGTTVGALASWYARHNRPLRSNGCVTTLEAQRQVSVRAPHLTMTPNKNQMSFSDLCKEMQQGVVALDMSWMNTDQQFSSGSLNANAGALFEVSNGQIVRRLWNTGLQWSTLSLLRALTAVGDQSTVRTTDTRLSKGMPWSDAVYAATAPAALFKEINVIATERA